MPEPNWAELLQQLEWADSGSSPDTIAALKAAVIALLRERVDNQQAQRTAEILRLQQEGIFMDCWGK